MDKLLKLFKDQKGASAVEYAIMVSLIAGVIVTAVWTAGLRINSALLYVVNLLPPR